MQTKSLLKKGLACAIIVLFVGASAVSAVESNPLNKEAMKKSKAVSVRGDIAYAWVAYDPTGQSGFIKFYLDNSGNSTFFNESAPSFITGSDFDTEGNWYAVAYNGGLYFIDPETGEMTQIANTIPLNSLTYDTTTDTWYVSGGSPDGLLAIDITTGVTTYVGSYGINNIMISIFCDTEGNMYGYDVLFDGNSHLYSIDKITGAATVIGDMGHDFCYSQDGKFDRNDGILYLVAYDIGMGESYLATCDPATGAVAIIYVFSPIGIELDGLAIPYGSQHPYANFTWTPTNPTPGETILFNASASYDSDGYITLYEWDWNHDGVYEESHTTPFAMHSWTTPGNYTITLQVTDNTSLKGTKSKTIVVEGINVTISGTMGQNGWYVSGVVITITGEGINHTYYSFDNQTWSEYMAPITISTDGIYTLYIRCEDPDGKEHYYGPYLFKIDKTPPVLNVTVTTNRLKTIWYIKVNVSDATSGVAALSFYIDDALVGNITPPGPGFSYIFKWKGRGHNAQVVAYDNAGNSASSSKITPCLLTYQPPYFPFYVWLFERFPHVFPILRHLLGY